MKIIILSLLLAFFLSVSTTYASTTIDAQVIRNQAGTGSTLISSGFPFPPGLVTESMITGGTIKVLVSGAEVAAHVSALRGRHNDGTLRSALIQFTVPSMAQNDVLTASVIVDGGARATADPAYVRPTWDMVKNNNIILPTDPDYITTTLITFQRLLPAAPEYLGVSAKLDTTPTAGGTIAEENQYSALADKMFDTLYEHEEGSPTSATTTSITDTTKAWSTNEWAGGRMRVLSGTGYHVGTTYKTISSSTSNTINFSLSLGFTPDETTVYEVSKFSEGTASYENVRAMLTLWARTGDEKYFNHAINYSTDWFRYNTPTQATMAGCSNNPYINPDGRTDGTNGSCGAPAEQYAPREFSYASLYLLTGYRDFWGFVANRVHLQESTFYISDQTTANSNVIKLGSYDTQRFNYISAYSSLIAAHAIDATTLVPNQGGQASVAFNWSNNFQWTLNAIKNNEWDLQWIPFNSGSGTVPTAGTTITQSGSGASASLLGVYLWKYDPQRFAGKAMPTSGYLMVNNVAGTFTSGSLSGISASATGANESDYRQGITGFRPGSPRVPNIWNIASGSISGTTLTVTSMLASASDIKVGTNLAGGSIPSGTFIVSQNSGTSGREGTYTISESCTQSAISMSADTVTVAFQTIFPNNFLIDYYLNVYADPRIPAMVKANLDMILMQIRPLVPGDGQYGLGTIAWGYPQYGKSYNLENPIVSAAGTAGPYELAEYPRFIAFVLKTLGSDTVNGATYETWYNRLVDTANNQQASGMMTWQWKLFGQFYGFAADAPWINAQTTITGPSSIRVPTNYAAIPGDTPDLARGIGIGGNAAFNGAGNIPLSGSGSMTLQ